jgi:hypothetical protein
MTELFFKKIILTKYMLVAKLKLFYIPVLDLNFILSSMDERTNNRNKLKGTGKHQHTSCQVSVPFKNLIHT